MNDSRGGDSGGSESGEEEYMIFALIQNGKWNPASVTLTDPNQLKLGL